MEENQPPITPLPQPPTVPSGPRFLAEKPKQDYFTRLFSGRLNRQNFIVGSTFFSLIPVIFFMIVLFNILSSPDAFAMPYLDPNNLNNIVMPQQPSVTSLVLTPKNELWTILGIIFTIITLPYVLSLQIRRLHDLNLNGWLWLVNFGSLVPFYSVFSSGITGLLTPKPDAFYWIAQIIGLLASFFSFYITCWSGTNGPNKYGDKPLPRSSFLGDILALR